MSAPRLTSRIQDNSTHPASAADEAIIRQTGEGRTDNNQGRTKLLRDLPESRKNVTRLVQARLNGLCHSFDNLGNQR